MGFCDEQELDPSWVCCLLDDAPDVTCCDDFSFDSAIQLPVFSDHPSVGPVPLSGSSKDFSGTSDCLDECGRKRLRGESSCAAATTRACREKLRRDRVNERFLELSAVLEPGKAPKLDKASILTDAIEMVKTLQHETTTLKKQNDEIQQRINELKSEKKELRSEKCRLKKAKGDIEQRIKSLGVPQVRKFRPCVTPPPPPPVCFGTPTQPGRAKLMPIFNYPGVPLWHFAPRASVDTSQDHAFHPPVA